MTANDEWLKTTADPLGLRELESIEPDYDGWAKIEAGLQPQQRNKRNWHRAGGWLAVAASLMLVVGVTLKNTQDTATLNTTIASIPVGGSSSAARDPQTTNNITALIGLSQKMQDQVKQMRQETTSMPAESAIYVAELEDLIAQLDNELSLTPDSVDLWGQRINLLLDLAQIYQQQWQIDYGRMASL